MIVAHSQPVAPVLCQSRELRLRPAAFIGIFFAVDRRNMRRILVEIRSSDPKLFFVRIDRLPQDFTPLASLRTCLALYAHEIGGKPMAITAAGGPARRLRFRRLHCGWRSVVDAARIEPADFSRDFRVRSISNFNGLVAKFPTQPNREFSNS
jgi:hypothetical protein